VPRVTGSLVQPRSRGVAIASALLLGGLGIHKFYLGKPGFGLAYLIFCWTFIPTLISLCEGIQYALMDEAEFQRRYSGAVVALRPAGLPD
jgi:TM2 domain-containing membrane protein YozV